METSQRCSPARPQPGASPVELDFTGAPADAARGTLVELEWEGQRRYFIQLQEWKATVWPCSTATVARITKGPWRLADTTLPQSGAARLVLMPAPARRGVRLTARDLKGQPVDGVTLRLEGCDRVRTSDGGVALTECDELSSERRASASKPWRLNVQTVPAQASSLDLTVLRDDETEPGKIGLGFSEADGTLRIAGMSKGGPAERAGLMRGDELLEVDGFGVRTVDDAKARIIGPAGVPVRLKLRRGTDVLLVDVGRQQ